MGAGRDLRQRVRLDPAVVAILHLLGKKFAAGRVDSLTDDGKWLVEADDDFFRFRADYCAWSSWVSFVLQSAGLYNALKSLVVKFLFAGGDAFVDELLQIALDISVHTSPVFEVGIARPAPGPHCRSVNGFRKTRLQFLL